MAPAHLMVVMGKGGVGKTTLATALALAHAEEGERVALTSLAGQAELGPAIREGWGPAPGTLEVVPLDPRAILDGLLGRLMPMPALAQLVRSHPAYDALYRIVPGVKEMALLHRLVELTEQGFHRVIVDGLSTGHGTHFLEAPGKSAHLLAGRLAERARALDRILKDPSRTSVLLATTLEEMPVRETRELALSLRAHGFPLSALLANRAVERVFPSPGAVQALEALAQRPRAAEVASEIGASWGMVQRLLRASAHVERSAREMEPHVAELRALGVPLAVLPLVPREEERLRVLSSRLKEVGR